MFSQPYADTMAIDVVMLKVLRAIDTLRKIFAGFEPQVNRCTVLQMIGAQLRENVFF